MKIQEEIENKQYPQEHREYLGMSEIGEPCKRKTWYTFRWCYDSSLIARIKRLFDRGKYEEQVLFPEILEAGYRFAHNKECEGPNKHIKGHPDEILIYKDGKEVVLEVKTANEKNFKQFQKLGIKNKSPEYYAQAQCYMHSLNLTECLFIITNKNTEERYYVVIYYCKEEAEHLMRIAEDIVFAKFPPPKISEDAHYFHCKYCNAVEICHYGEEIKRNCRTCQNFLIHYDCFTCALTDRRLSKQEQIDGCPEYRRIEI